MSPQKLPDSAVDLERLPTDAIALRILGQIADADRPIGRRNYLGSIVTNIEVETRRRQGVAGMLRTSHDQALYSNPQIAHLLAEAWGWLEAEKLIALSPFADPAGRPEDAYIVTRLGKQVAQLKSDGHALLAARRRLGVELHGELRDELRDLVGVGAFEQAAFTALRLVEERVRRLAKEPRAADGSLLAGVALMRKAFGPKGLLADPQMEKGEQQGLSDLFAGAFGAVRNPLGHTTVRWADPTEAAEFVLFADLLMRQLDRVCT